MTTAEFPSATDTMLAGLTFLIVLLVAIVAACIIGAALVVVFCVALIRDTWKAFGPAQAVAVLLAVATATAPMAARAQDRAEEPESAEELPPAPRLHLMDRGARAPFAGILAPEELFVDWRNRIVILEERLRIEAEAATARLEVERQLGTDRLAAEVARRELVSGLYEQRIETLAEEVREAREAAELGFFEQPAFWFAMGVLVTGLGVALVAVALGGV